MFLWVSIPQFSHNLNDNPYVLIFDSANLIMIPHKSSRLLSLKISSMVRSSISSLFCSFICQYCLSESEKKGSDSVLARADM